VLDLVMASDEACKPGRRTVADNIWTGTPMADLLPGICHIADLTHQSFMTVERAPSGCEGACGSSV
jgi:DMSO/TMAO reductase YedYZ molybdopterin-dependent catalytic subunit